MDEGRAEGDDDAGEQTQALRPGEAEEERRRDPDFGIVTFDEMRRHYDERARVTGIRALPEEAERRYWEVLTVVPPGEPVGSAEDDQMGVEPVKPNGMATSSTAVPSNALNGAGERRYDVEVGDVTFDEMRRIVQTQARRLQMVQLSDDQLRQRWSAMGVVSMSSQIPGSEAIKNPIPLTAGSVTETSAGWDTPVAGYDQLIKGLEAQQFQAAIALSDEGPHLVEKFKEKWKQIVSWATTAPGVSLAQAWNHAVSHENDDIPELIRFLVRSRVPHEAILNLPAEGDEDAAPGFRQAWRIWTQRELNVFQAQDSVREQELRLQQTVRDAWGLVSDDNWIFDGQWCC